MKLLPTQTDKASLSHLGQEAVTLLKNRDFQSLADRFGYVLAYGRNPATAIDEGLRSCLAEFHATPNRQEPLEPSIDVKYFKPSDDNLIAVVECFFATAEGCPILAELIVTSLGDEKHITLEQVSLA
jgi:hypothetical protein